MDDSTWIPIMGNEDIETANGKRVNAWETKDVTYGYASDSQLYTAVQTGYYKIETWGAQGGEYTSAQAAGKGGYSSSQTHNNDFNYNIYINEVEVYEIIIHDVIN